MKKYEKELSKVFEEVREEPEDIIVPLIKNSYKSKGKMIDQFKVNIPKEFSDAINLNKEDFEVELTLNTEGKGKITMEIRHV